MNRSPEKYCKILLISLSLILFLSSIINAQENTGVEIARSLAEEISLNEEASGVNLETLADKIYELENDPVRINSGNIKELGRLFFLTEYQIRNLSEYVRQNGKIISLEELSSIEGFDIETANWMAPFITLDDRPDYFSGNRARLSHSLLANFALKPETADTIAPGSPWRILLKYKMTTGRFSAGFTAEKDTDEKFLSGKPPIPDFCSGYFCYNGSGFLQKVILGDYSMQFGTGTLINTSFMTGFSVAELATVTSQSKINPYTSTDENNFFRGAAIVLGKGKFETTLFGSRNQIDATIMPAGDSQKIFIKNLYTAGLHNTPGTIMKKDILTEYTWGINIAGYFRKLTAGFLVTENIFSAPFLPDRSKPENLFEFEGRRHLLAGIYYSLATGRFILSGEADSDSDYNMAITQSVSFVPGDRISFGFIYRNYSPAFVSFHGKGVLSGTKPSNEESLTGNVKFEAAKNFFILAGSEVKRYPWAKYLITFPSESVQSELKLKFISKKINIEGMYNFRHSESNLSNDTGMPEIRETITNTVSFRIQFLPSDNLTSITRIGFKTFNEDVSAGVMMSQDIIWSPQSIPVRIWFRHSLFSTGSWNTRLYAWEYDLRNSFSIPALSGKGSRSYIMAELKLGNRCSLRVKYSITSKILTPVEEQFTDEIKFQFRLLL